MHWEINTIQIYLGVPVSGYAFLKPGANKIDSNVLRGLSVLLVQFWDVEAQFCDGLTIGTELSNGFHDVLPSRCFV